MGETKAEGGAGDGATLWTAVDAYLADHLIAKDEVLEAALAESEAAGLPQIQVTPLQGKMLQIFARMVGARRILEVGTLGGYSTIWLARALPPDGRLVSLELDPGHAEVAERHIPAAESLEQLTAEEDAPFDLVFIDADKRSTPEYFAAALELCRPGAVIVADN